MNNLISLPCETRRLFQASAGLLGLAALALWGIFPWHPVGETGLVLGMAGAWVLASLSTRRMDLGAKQGLFWTGFQSLCFDRDALKEEMRGVNPHTGKSQRMDIHWLSQQQRDALTVWQQGN